MLILVGVATALALGLLIDLINGILVVPTAVSSFIVTPGSLFAVAGLTLGTTVLVTASTGVPIKANPLGKALFGRERQALAIARAVHFEARVLILDEPTAALGVNEAAHVLCAVLQARRKGVAVIFIAHNAGQALTLGDHFAVLIRGAKSADFRKGEKTREEITDLMAGGEAMAELEAEIESCMTTHEGHPSLRA